MKTQAGYGRFSLGGSKYLAHRIAYVITNGDTELNVLHICNHPWCVNPNHLYAGTQSVNMQQCYAEGRAANNLAGQNPDNRGERSGCAKLTEEEICRIRKAYTGGQTQRKIARQFGISQYHVSCICSGKRWSHVKFGELNASIS